MRKAAFSILILAGLFLLQAGCAPDLTSVNTPADVPAITPAAESVVEGNSNPEATEPPQLGLPLTGASAGSLGAVALTIEEQRSANTFSIVPVSADTGKPVASILANGSPTGTDNPRPEAQPLVLGGAIAYGFSNDRSQMAFLSNRTEGCPAFCLRVMDLRTWEEMIDPIHVEKSLGAWFTVPRFDEASSIIPLILNKQTDTVSELLLVDRTRGEVAARTRLPASIFQVATTPEGDLAVHGVKNTSSGGGPLLYVGLFDGADLSPLWEATLAEVTLFEGGEVDHADPMQGQYYDPANVFSLDGSKLYLVAADRPELVTVDFREQTIETVRIQPKRSWLDRLLAGTVSVAHAKIMNGVSKTGVMSQDGRYLYVVGQESRAIKNDRGEYDVEFIPLGLQVIDVEDGTLVRQVTTEASYLTLSPDGKSVLLHGWRRVKGGNAHPWTDVMDVSGWKVTQRLDGTAQPSRLLDGSLAWLVVEEGMGATSTISLYRPGDSVPRSQIIRSGYLDWIPIP